MSLIINADDWGCDKETTDRTLECLQHRSVSSVSAMVFMDDSERAAAIARDQGISVGLHLNLTAPFSSSARLQRLAEHQRRVSGYLRLHRFTQATFNPFLANSFHYLAAAQLEEFACLYGAEPKRVDGHHHMHLCANVMLQKLVPSGTAVRRNFSFEPGEKSLWNNLYRRFSDHILAKRYRITDLFYSLAPLQPLSRLQKIFSLAKALQVEVETHPVKQSEYQFLCGGEIFRCAGDVPIEAGYPVSAYRTSAV